MIRPAFWSVLALAVVAAIAGYAAYSNHAVEHADPRKDLGTYSYACDQGVAFTLTIAADVQSVEIAPLSGKAFPPAGVLLRNSAVSSPQFGGRGILLTPHGETLTLQEGNAAVQCNPVADQENAPFDFGD